jgi:hypothetical protein
MNRVLLLGCLLVITSFLVACAADTDDQTDQTGDSSSDIVTASGPTFASVEVTASNSPTCDSCSVSIVQSWADVMLHGQWTTHGTVGGAASFGCSGSWARTSHGFFRDTYTVSVTCPNGNASAWAVWADDQARRAEE